MLKQVILTITVPAVLSAPALISVAPAGAQALPVPAGLHSQAARSPAQEPPAPHHEVYVVRKGDTLSGIAAHEWGERHAGWWPQIWDQNQNKLSQSTLILPGQRLKIWSHWRHQPRIPVVLRPSTTHATTVAYTAPRAPSQAPVPPGGGSLGCGGLEALWVSAGGPASQEVNAASVAMAESGGRQYAYNPSGASGYWQILGQVVAGDIFDPYVNARNAVVKYLASGWAPWTTWPAAAGLC